VSRPPWGEYRTTDEINRIVPVCCPNCGIRGRNPRDAAADKRPLVALLKKPWDRHAKVLRTPVASTVRTGRLARASDRPADLQRGVHSPQGSFRVRWVWTKIYFGRADEVHHRCQHLQPASLCCSGMDRKQKRSMSFSEPNLSGPPGGSASAGGVAWICGDRSSQHRALGPRNARIVYDTFHILQHANTALDEVGGRAEVSARRTYRLL